MYKLFALVMLALCFTLQAENGDKKSDDKNVAEESVIIEEEEELFVDTEDEDLLKASEIDKKSSENDSLSDDTIENSQVQNSEKEEAVKNESKGELILDGGEESILSEEKLIPQSPDVKEEAVTKESTETAQETDSEESGQFQSRDAVIEKVKKSYRPDPQTRKKVKESMQSGPKIPSPEEGIDIKEIAPAKIEKMQSINFAENVSQYRSPKLAMLMSFLVPGTGQAYAKCGWRAGLYGAVEAAIIGIGATFGVKGKNAKKDAKDFADKHYDFSNLEEYYDVLSRHVSDTTINEIFSYPSIDTFEVICKEKKDDFYKLIRENDNTFIRGWDDVTPGFDPVTFIVDNENYKQIADSLYLVYKMGSDSTKAQFGFSENQEKYDDMMAESNSHYRVSKNVLTLLIVNHIVSAIDAGITARAYNDKLLGKQSFWQKINLKEQQIATGSGILNGYALQVRF